MTRAVEALGLEPAWVLVDGNALPKWQRPSKAIVDGDAKCRSIAAASIIAKVTRDRMMADYARELSGLWLGDATAAIRRPSIAARSTTLGLTPLHRRSFGPVREFEAAQRAAGARVEEIAAASPFESHHQGLSPRQLQSNSTSCGRGSFGRLFLAFQNGPLTLDRLTASPA